MQLDISNSDLQTLLALYNQEIEKLKEKLLNGETWENVKPIRRNITELAIAIQKSHGYNVAVNSKTNQLGKEPVSQANHLSSEVAE